MIHIVLGAKGGVGKSLFSLALIELIGNDNVYVIDADYTSQDVTKSSKDKVKTEVINLENRDGYEELKKIISTNKDFNFVINTPAANTTSISNNLGTLIDFSKTIKKLIKIWWLVNQNIDSVLFLKEFLDQFEDYNLDITVVINKYFGEPEKFSYTGSNTAKKISKVITINRLSTGVVNAIYKDRELLKEIIENGRMCDRLSVNKFMRELKEQLV